MEIKYISRDEASKIIETRKPRGLFYETDNGFYVGIDNSNGDAWVEEFKTKEECFNWLRGERERTVEEKEEYLTELERKQLKIIDHYGADWQLDRLVEECSELIKVIMKVKRESSYFICDDMIQEVADVKNLIRQLELKHEYFKDSINFMIEQKVDRQLERIKGEG
ncbi:MAG TPA: hypothetical protein VFD17_00640 [Clostridia bacterium]|nr:hypothetical protein [Clostridia bacterium]